MTIEPISVESIEGLAGVASPALVVIDERVEQNVAEMIRIAGGAGRLRPHCKTHKLEPIIRRALGLGISKHKCATIAEAEMLANAGVGDIFIAYPPVGPNVERVLRLCESFPEVSWSVATDHADVIRGLSREADVRGVTVGVLLDIDAGMHRTGIGYGDDALALYGLLSELPGVTARGLHVYDGHHREREFADRMAAVQATFDETLSFCDLLADEGWEVPSIVAGGTGSFPCFASLDDPRLELSPGTVVFHDAGYDAAFPDLAFVPAAWLLTRVISVAGSTRITVDLGHKAVAADPPAGSRVHFPDLPGVKEVIHSEEHLTLELAQPGTWKPGDSLLAVPVHICPTTALHQEVVVVRESRVEARWPVTARDRRLTI